MNLSKPTKLIFLSGVTAVYFFLFILGIETLLGDGLESTLVWQRERTAAYVLNVLIVLSLFLLLLGLINRYLVSFVLTNAIVLLLAVISYYKFSFLGEFLYPWDMFLYNNVLNLLPNLFKEVDLPKLIAGSVAVLLIVGGIAAYTWIKKPKRIVRLKWWLRILFIGAGAAYLSLFVFYRTIPGVEAKLQETAEVTNITWDQNKNYKDNGFLTAFLLNMQSAIVLPPSGYNEKNVLAIAEELKKVKAGGADGEKPNIVFIMSESFWDPTVMENIRFEPDPMPFVRKEQDGWVLSSTFGGGTSNIEFEALTGFTNTFLPTGSVPYQQYIKHSIPALPNYLSGLGYTPLAIHPYPRWFWNREEVYKHMGFEEFMDIEGFKDPIYKGPFVSDHQVTKTIIEKVDQHEEPVFIHAVTMQNHTSYNSDKYEEFTVSTEVPEGVDQPLNLLLRSYTQGIADADAAFKELAEYLSASEEPTVVVFFGDHLPALGPDYKLYKQADFVPRGPGEENWELEDFRDMRSTPLAVWNNFGAETPELGTISPAHLGSVALSVAGIERPLFYEALDEFRSVMPGYSADVKIDAAGELYRVTPDEVESVKQKYELLQYDLLFGEQYSRDILFGTK